MPKPRLDQIRPENRMDSMYLHVCALKRGKLLLGRREIFHFVGRQSFFSSPMLCSCTLTSPLSSERRLPRRQCRDCMERGVATPPCSLTRASRWKVLLCGTHLQRTKTFPVGVRLPLLTFSEHGVIELHPRQLWSSCMAICITGLA